MTEALIAGIDPGSTSAVAAVNLDGEKVLLESRRGLSRSEIIKMLIDAGKPVLIASDTRKMPSNVEKIASSLGAGRFEPDEDMSRRKKQDLGKGENSHEKDAMAAAVNAYRNLQRELKKIDSCASRTSKPRKEVAKNYFSRSQENLSQTIK